MRITDPCGTVRDQVEDDCSGCGAQKQNRDALVGERFSKKEDRDESQKGGGKNGSVVNMPNSKWVGDCPSGERKCKTTPAGSKKSTTEEHRSEWLEIGEGLRESAPERTECDEESYDQTKWKIALHDSGRIVDFSLRG